MTLELFFVFFFPPPFFQSVSGSKWRVVCHAFSVGVSFYDNLLHCPYCHHQLQPPPQNHFADVMTHNCLLDFPGRSFISSRYLYKNGREDVKLTGANGKFWYPFRLGIVFWQAMRNMSQCVHTEGICLVCKLHARYVLWTHRGAFTDYSWWLRWEGL